MSVDSEGKLHGVCGFNLIDEHINQTVTPEFFHWSFKFISGRFVHGHIDGLVLLSTWQGTAMYANIVDGVLHGPAFATLRQPVFDIWVGQSILKKHFTLSQVWFPFSEQRIHSQSRCNPSIWCSRNSICGKVQKWKSAWCLLVGIDQQRLHSWHC